ncbi:hypothetical protein DPMN_022984 [Dreissena polymorpha]|uniref:Uncharacterized protein n=1 Tax=Dreissena polymorpha TaxID=45954 RepID=A0A9D4LLF0_DREPO|nr:hypothetical protein DPMN_022984 [Dreissena polymorpha]
MNQFQTRTSSSTHLDILGLLFNFYCKCSKEELGVQSALRALEKALSTPTRQKFEKQIKEGYDIVDRSRCFDVYKKPQVHK